MDKDSSRPTAIGGRSLPVGMIQKQGGNLWAQSQIVLGHIGNALIEKTDGASLPNMRQGRLGDALSLLRAGHIDFAIISCGVVEAWGLEAVQICLRGMALDRIVVLGPAACRWMMQVPIENRKVNWTDIIASSQERDGPAIVTTSGVRLNHFLAQHGLDGVALSRNGHILVQEGGTEATARHLISRYGNPVLVFDAVATGGTAFRNGFTPVFSEKNDRSSEHNVVLVGASAVINANPFLKDFFAVAEEQVQKIAGALRSHYLEVLAAGEAAAFDTPALSRMAKSFVRTRRAEVQELYS